MLFIENTYFRLAYDADATRNSASYERVKEEINRGSSPLSGATNWQLIVEECRKMASAPGLDFLMCAYYTVANLKVRGLQGYADGVELLSRYLNEQPQPTAKIAKMQKDVLEWVNAKSVSEIKALRPNHDALRELYRGEYYCEHLHRVVEHWESGYQVDFSGVGWVIFEHIDRIESNYHGLIRQQDENNKAESAKAGKNKRVLVFFTAIVVALGVGTFSFLNKGFQKRTSVPAFHTVEQARQYQNATPELKQTFHKQSLVDVYQRSILEKSEPIVELERAQALNELASLKYLYPGDKQVQKIEKQVAEIQEDATDSTDKLLLKFRNIRTEIANIALLAQRSRWSEVKERTQKLEEYAVSLSPIYGRVDYIKTLIEEGEEDKARQELGVLYERLSDLSWTVAELDQDLNAGVNNDKG